MLGDCLLYTSDAADDGVGVEAGSELGWHKYIGSNGIFIGMKTFGASAPANHLFEHFGLSSDRIRDKILSKINL